jgi:hypothetical protein
MKPTTAETGLMTRKWTTMIHECKKQMIKGKGTDFWEQNFHETRIRRFVEKHADSNEILKLNLQYLVVVTKLQHANIRNVSMDLLTYNKEGKVKCLFCDDNEVLGYMWEPMPNNDLGRDTGFLFLLCNKHEDNVQKDNVLITQAVDQLYSQNKY